MIEKITEGQLSTYGVTAAPDRLTGTAAENKAVFDRLIKQVVAVQYNALVEALTALTGAAEIGAEVEGVDAQTVQGILDAYKALLEEKAPLENVLTLDNEKEYTPTAEYHPVTKQYADQLALDSGAVFSVFGRAGAVLAQKGDYTPELVGAAPEIKTTTVTLGADAWTGEGPWTQPLAHEAIGKGTRINFYPDGAVLAQMEQDMITALYAENDGGKAQAVALGKNPTADIVIQTEFVEVEEV